MIDGILAECENYFLMCLKLGSKELLKQRLNPQPSEYEKLLLKHKITPIVAPRQTYWKNYEDTAVLGCGFSCTTLEVLWKNKLAVAKISTQHT